MPSTLSPTAAAATPHALRLASSLAAWPSSHQVPPEPVPDNDPLPDQQPAPDEEPIPNPNPVTANFPYEVA